MEPLEFMIPFSFFAFVFAIVYIFVNARNRERLALIDKGMDASIFSKNKESYMHLRKMNILTIALSLIGVGIGIVMGIFLYDMTGKEGVYPASICIMAGLGLYASTLMNKKKSE